MPDADRSRRHPLVDELAEERLVAIVRAGHEVPIAHVAEILLAGRIRFIEVTLTTPGAIEAITALQPYRANGLRVGAGTVLSRTDATSATGAGVDFLVSPTVEPDVVDVAHDAGCAAIIGGLTPTEILAARRAGADVVKVFPGRVATPGYFADLAGPFPDIPLMPTGNVDLDTAQAYLGAGAIAVGVGKALVNPQSLAAGRFDELTAAVARWREVVDGAMVTHG
jgi:2-dehydro-3-deoxyphosphogluconate aldolase / (4S)-4-hydroxy-2-oxoglutarate aldolase